MTLSFDPRARLAAFLHPRVCPGHPTGVDPVDCLLMPSAIEAYRAGLAEAGLAVVPLDAVVLLERLITGLAAPDTPAEAAPRSASEARAHAATWLVSRQQDGAEVREGPFTRAWAEIVLADHNLSHPRNIVSARLEGEPGWMADLDATLGDDGLDEAA